jgi:hypothetical protein
VFEREISPNMLVGPSSNRERPNSVSKLPLRLSEGSASPDAWS